MVDRMNGGSPVTNFSVRNSGGILLETDFPRLGAIRASRRYAARALDIDALHRRKEAARVVADLERQIFHPRRSRPMAFYLPAAPMATRRRPAWGKAAMLVAVALAVALAVAS